ncbi:D-isomer specific 2-hydroxyacid dehydrogenase NAD-binding protein [Sodalis praecaptivus]|uniref:D-isomer specific 2-hydroxyacid dehydrogenase NAD-binding protein n=1 Tax=Sodalis praecaptivus TaxID=1239307 RepID=W0HVI9_9GAMM|nr:hydroxyacid dehydrogenase [Sodalis praecaptivus]AHF77871.1 D-isomer specific 2-hydroxyacid dehydrogenase NAD-binding protein [Sodalis praecaptivus]
MTIRAVFFSDHPHKLDQVYGAGRRQRIAALADVYPIVISSANWHQHQEALANIDVIFSSWGMPTLPESAIDAMVNVQALFYAAGATDYFCRPYLRRNITVVSAWQANAIPVAEFCLAQILLAFKGYYRVNQDYTGPSSFKSLSQHRYAPGAYGDTVALLGAGAIADKLRALLSAFDLRVLVIPSRPKRRTVSLESAFEQAFVISNHLPNRSDNAGLIKGEHFARMRHGAVFINTGRGAQINETEMVNVLRLRPDLTALLDVTSPEPPLMGSPLYTLPNIRLTSHIAGAMNDETRRLADYVIEEFNRWLNGQPLHYQITENRLMTHAC